MKIQGSKVLLTGVNGGLGRAAASLALALILISIKTRYAQSAPTPAPTTKILAIGTINPGIDLAKVNAILPREAKATVNLYLEGKIDQWYSLQDRKGVAFILNVTNLAAAQEMLEKLPLGQAHIMSFELIALGPLNPLRKLPGMSELPE
jgi:hypothetical protein